MIIWAIFLSFIAELTRSQTLFQHTYNFSQCGVSNSVQFPWQTRVALASLTIYMKTDCNNKDFRVFRDGTMTVDNCGLGWADNTTRTYINSFSQSLNRLFKVETHPGMSDQNCCFQIWFTVDYYCTNLTNCQTCSSYDVCTQCLSGFLLDSAGSCKTCSELITNCLTCADNTTCTNCNSGYFVDSGLCKTCPEIITNCITCSTNTSCWTCDTGFFVDSSGTCKTCPQIISYCNTCASNTTCSNCDSAYFVNNLGTCSTCPQLIPNCNTCASNISCSICDSGYFVSADVCKTCPDIITNCITCASNTSCSVCDTGYLVNLGTCQTCPTIIPNCNTCASNTSCTTCDPGYLVSSGLCDTCPNIIPNCNTCTDNTTCSICDPGYLVSSGLCKTCPNIFTNCVTCASNTSCSVCDTGFFVSSNVCKTCAQIITNCNTCPDNLTCSACDSGFFLSSNLCKTCPQIITNCNTCGSNTTCTTCDSGFFVDTGTCKTCPQIIANCNTCTSNTTCSVCDSGYLVSTGLCKTCPQIIANCNTCASNTSCTACDAGYFVSSSVCKTCPQIITNCVTCVSNTTCSVCSTGFFLDFGLCKACGVLITNCNTCASNTTCSVCNAGYFVQSGACKTCAQIIENCNTCASNTTCSICNPGYPLVASGLCESCALNNPGCSLCYSDLTCQICSGNLILNFGRCYPCGDVIKNCLSCQDSSTCLQCANPFQVDSNKKCNKCQHPLVFASQFCSPQQFCVSAFKDLTNKIVCVFCDLTQHYYINSNFQCVCVDGYKEINTICTNICGDGKLFDAQCDDNNTVDGDGCSSICKIEADFLCEQLSSGVSKCRFNQNIRLKLDYIDKIVTQNKALMYFSLDTTNPNTINFFKSKLLAITLASNRSQTITILSISKNDQNQFVVQIEYNQTVEDSGIYLNFKFSKDQVISDDHQLKFLLKGNNFPLTISGMSQKFQQVSQVQIYFISISYVIAIIFLLADKFIAVEALCTFQMVFFSLLLIYKNSSWNQALNTVLPLKYSMGFNQLIFQQVNFANHLDLSFKKFRYLKMCETFIMNNFTNALILIVLSLVFLVLFYIKTRMEHTMMEERNPIQKKYSKKSFDRFSGIFKKFYNLTFNFSYSMIFQVLVSLYIECSYMKSISRELKVINKIVAMWTFLVIIFTLLDKYKHMFLTKEETLVETYRVGRTEERYKAVYLTYIVINALGICLFNNKVLYGVFPSAILGALAVMYLFFLMIYRPYQYSFGIHGFTIIFCHLIYLISLTLVTLLNYEIKIEEIYLLYFCYTLLAFSIIIIILTFIRVFLEYKYGAEMVADEMRKQIEEREQIELNQFAKKPNLHPCSSNIDEYKHKRNNYMFLNAAKKQEKITFLNQLKAKSFLTEQERDNIFYKFYKQKPLDWVEKHQKKAKYIYLLQKDQEALQQNTYKKELDRKKQEKARNTAQIDELKILKDKMRGQHERKLQRESRKKSERKEKRHLKKTLYQELPYENL